MTSHQKSALPHRDAASLSIESPGGAYHPHRIEVQEFSTYGLIADLRPLAEYRDDHVPGAVQIDPPVDALTGQPVVRVPTALQALVEALSADEAILVYDGVGGQVAEPLAAALRSQGRDVDVLPGGWINYRRWVEAGLQLVPRLFQWRVVGCALGTEAAHVLQALKDERHQVVDVAALADWCEGRLVQVEQPSQALFESRLLDALRQLDGRCPVWTAELLPHAGMLTMPATLLECLAIAPVVAVDADLQVRVRQWRIDEPALDGDPDALARWVARMDSRPDPALLDRWRQQFAEGKVDPALCSVLEDWLDRRQAAPADDRRHRLPKLVVESFALAELRRAVRAAVAVPG